MTVAPAVAEPQVGGGSAAAPAAPTRAAPMPPAVAAPHAPQHAPAPQPDARPPPSAAAAEPLTLEPLSIAYYCTGHGLGHATRAIEVRACCARFWRMRVCVQLVEGCCCGVSKPGARSIVRLFPGTCRLAGAALRHRTKTPSQPTPKVCKHLVARGHTVTVVTGAPARVFLQQVPAARFTLRKVRGGGWKRGRFLVLLFFGFFSPLSAGLCVHPSRPKTDLPTTRKRKPNSQATH